MYNGIGLHTPRGSATSGHVTKNLSHVKRKRDFSEAKEGADERMAPKVSIEISGHNKKRLIEAKLFELEENMIELGYDDEEIQQALATKRITLEKDIEAGQHSNKTKRSTNESLPSEIKSESNEKMRKALRLSDKSDSPKPDR